MGVWTPGPGGTTGNDTFTGDGANETAAGGRGNDTLNGNGGADTLSAGSFDYDSGPQGVDVLNGGDGDDALRQLSLYDTADGGAGTDTVTVSLTGTLNNVGVQVENFLGIDVDLADAITGTLQLNIGGTGGGGSVTLSNVEIFQVTFGAGNDRAFGGNLNDSLEGDAYNFSGGDDELHGRGGNDNLYGGAGSDLLYGDAGDDSLQGGEVSPGADDYDPDALYGGDGNDTLEINSGDLADGGADIDDVRLMLHGIDTGYTFNISNIPASGTPLDLGDGTRLVAVETVSEIWLGDGDDTIVSGDWDDYIIGNLGADDIHGGEGENLINGEQGADTLRGGSNQDTLYGEADNDTLLGGAGDDVVNGGTGNDVLWGHSGVDLISGWTGDDTIWFDNGDVAAGEIINGGADTDTLVARGVIDFQGASISNIEELRLIHSGAAVVYFRATQLPALGNLAIEGHAGGGNLIVVFGAGAASVSIAGWSFTNWNAMSGDEIVLTAQDNAQAFTGSASAVERVSYSSAASGFTLSLLSPASSTGAAAGDAFTDINQIEGSTYADTLTGDGAANHFIGDQGDDTLNGNGGADTLDGGAGADTMAGGDGDDLYLFQTGDTLIEFSNKGTDTVHSSVDFTLANHFENLTLLTAAIGTGNNVANVLTGSLLADTLHGLNGADTLIGAGGADAMHGGAGDDLYIVEQVGDTTIETANKGVDTIQTALAWSMANHVENLTLLGSANVNGTGNGLANTITGNSGANIIDGKAGADTMIGGLGDDTYVIESQNDVIIENAGEGADSVKALFNYTLAANVENLTLDGAAANGSGNELGNVIRGNALNNILQGLDGNDLLLGGLGNDRLTGGNGADAFVFNTMADNTTNRDQITDFNVADDTIRLDNAVFTALGSNGVLNANYFVTGAAAADSNDYIIYNSANGSLFYDADGNGAGAAVRFATVTAGLAMTNADFLVI